MPPTPRTQVDAVRRFNRAYTRRLGVLGRSFLDSEFSLTEARVLHELSEGEKSASEIGAALGLDAGYLSRILDRFEKARMIKRRAAPDDRRRSIVSLTRTGKAAHAPLEARSRAHVGAMIAELPSSARTQLLGAMSVVAKLTARDESAPRIALRTHRPGDMGWITMRHGAIYAEEYGYGPLFEALAAEVSANFLKNYDPKSERCWIAEMDDVPAGSLALIRADAKTAKLRLMLLEPWARGQGIAQKLVDESIAFAKSAGYEKIILWTQSELLAARKLYARAGFKLIASKPHNDFGKELTSEIWELPL